MADCHDLFQGFHQDILIPKSKKNKMTKSRDCLRDRVRLHFKENHPEYTPRFYIQGSVKMGTGIRTEDDICDLDDGIYFFREHDVSATTLQTWIKEAVEGYTSTPPEHRKKCIRSIFAGDYEIDMPVYYKIDGQEYQLAVKNEKWEDSDPKAMVDWLNERKDAKGQLVRMIKYLKAWCDHKRYHKLHKMPSGLAITILAANAKDKFYYNDRDDITLRDTLKEIKKALDIPFECFVPVVPGDDLFAEYDDTRKMNFLTALSEFLEDAERALREANHLKASRLWKKHLGNRFPLGEDKEEDTRTIAGIVTGASTSRPWAI